jgi:hypothetical protein
MKWPLDPLAADKLAKLCGMFGSEYDGERAVAAALADQLVRDLGLTWQQVITVSPWSEPKTIAEQIGVALAHAETLSPWERKFVHSISGFQRLSPKQRSVLDSIIGKLRAYRTARAA